LNSTPEEQARYVIRLNTESMAAQLDVMIWWTLVDPGQISGANGLVTQDLSLKPAYTSYRNMTNILEHARYQRAVTRAESGSSSVEGYVFESYAEPTDYVLWYNGAGTQLMDIPGSQVQVTSMMGSATTVNDGDLEDVDHAVNNRIRLSVGVDPIYVEVIH
jgi:hypothetical protein